MKGKMAKRTLVTWTTHPPAVRIRFHYKPGCLKKCLASVCAAGRVRCLVCALLRTDERLIVSPDVVAEDSGRLQSKLQWKRPELFQRAETKDGVNNPLAVRS